MDHDDDDILGLALNLLAAMVVIIFEIGIAMFTITFMVIAAIFDFFFADDAE